MPCLAHPDNSNNAKGKNLRQARNLVGNDMVVFFRFMFS